MSETVTFPRMGSKLYLLTDQHFTPYGFYDTVPEARSAAAYRGLQHWHIWHAGSVEHSSATKPIAWKTPRNVAA